MNPHSSLGLLSLGHYGFFKRPGTEEDCSLLRVARTWINPVVEAGMREQEAQAQQQAALLAEQASAVKRPLGRLRSSAILQGPPAEQEEQAVLMILPISYRLGAQV